MDHRLLEAYNAELAYLRETAREFGDEHEAVAGRLGLKTPTDPDPYVERLLEGVAFLSARVQLKLQDQYPEFSQHLLQAVQPHFLAPTPSICIASFDPKEGDPGLVRGVSVPRGTELTANAADQGNVPVLFKTAHPVTMWPIKIIQAEYLGSRAAIAPFAGTRHRAEAGLRLRFAATAGAQLNALTPGPVSLYLDGSESIPGELYRQLAGETMAVVARDSQSAGGPDSWIELPRPEQVGFRDDEALLPAEARSFRGYRLLSEYFACPERFLFVSQAGLDKVFPRCGETCDVIFLFSRSVPMLTGSLTPANFRLFSTPAINLFEKTLGRVQVNAYEHEYHVVPDRTRPVDFEVYRVLDVKAYGRDAVEPQTVAPLHAFGALLYDWRNALFYTTRLSTRRLSTREQRQRRVNDYIGTETWISLTAPERPELIAGIQELGVRALVTNRELPQSLTFRGEDHFTFSGVSAHKASVVRAPTAPRPPLGLNDAAWRVIGHLTPNYATLIDQPNGDPALLRDHLALYSRPDDASSRRQVDGVLSVSSRMISRRVPGQDRMAIARGHQVRIRLDDASFDRARMFVFSAILERFLAEFASINTFTECVFESLQEGVFVTWPPRIGRQHNI
jgi:type VI secretion system protein ImpG